ARVVGAQREREVRGAEQQQRPRDERRETDDVVGRRREPVAERAAQRDERRERDRRERGGRGGQRRGRSGARGGVHRSAQNVACTITNPRLPPTSVSRVAL